MKKKSLQLETQKLQKENFIDKGKHTVKVCLKDKGNHYACTKPLGRLKDVIKSSISTMRILKRYTKQVNIKHDVQRVIVRGREYKYRIVKMYLK